MARLPITINTDSVREMYERGFSIPSIGKALGVSPETIRKRMKDSGIKRRPAGGIKLDENRPFCKHGHSLKDHKYVSKAGRILCKECRRIWEKKRYKQNYERVRARQIKRIKSNPDLYALKSKIFRLKQIGLSHEDYAAIFESQKGLCAICEQPETDTYRGKVRSLAVDHDHTTGIRRGLLCRRCNCILGMFNDDITLFYKAIEYLTRDAPEKTQCNVVS